MSDKVYVVSLTDKILFPFSTGRRRSLGRGSGYSLLFQERPSEVLGVVDRGKERPEWTMTRGVR